MAEKNLGRIVGKMGEPAWHTLHTLSAKIPKTRAIILEQLNQTYTQANYDSEINDDALRLILKRLGDSHLSTLFNPSVQIIPHYIRTPLGNEAVAAHQRLYVVMFGMGDTNSK